MSANITLYFCTTCESGCGVPTNIPAPTNTPCLYENCAYVPVAKLVLENGQVVLTDINLAIWSRRRDSFPFANFAGRAGEFHLLINNWICNNPMPHIKPAH